MSRPKSPAPPTSDGPPSSGRGRWPEARKKDSSLPPPPGKPSPFAPASPPASAPARPSAPARASAPSPPASGKSQRPGSSQRPGDWDDKGDDDWAEAPLEVGLDLGEDVSPLKQPVSRAPAAQAGTVSAPPKPKVVVGGPAGRSMAPELPEAPPGPPPPDHDEVAALADYGPAPGNVLLAPVYAWRVMRRRRELTELLALQQRTHEVAKRSVRERQAELVDRLVERAGAASLAPVLGPIEDARKLVEERKAAIELTSGQTTARFLAIERELEAEQKSRKQLQRDRDMAQIKLEDAVHKRAQTAAELKNHNIRIEGAHDAARKAAAPGAELAPPAHAQEIVALEAQRERLAEQLKGRDRAVSEARADLRAREDQIHALDSRIHGVHGRQAALEKQGSQAENAGRSALKLAEERRLAAYEAALEALVRDAPQLVDAPTKAQIEELSRASGQCDRDLEKHRLAVDAYDRSAYQRGIAMAMGGAAVVLLLLILIARVK